MSYCAWQSNVFSLECRGYLQAFCPADKFEAGRLRSPTPAMTSACMVGMDLLHIWFQIHMSCQKRQGQLTHFMAGAQKWMVLGPAGELMNFCKALWVAAGAAMV